MKKFYLETFGCQMNVHDSEKVIGTLVHLGYGQTESIDEAGLVLYNTCSIRDKAEQKVFNKLVHGKKQAAAGKIFGVLGCVAQQEGERIFERAPHVSFVCGSASYTKLGELIARVESGDRRVTGLSLDTDETFDTPFTRRDNPFRAYITIIEGCDKSCSYCVVPFTRGPERSRTSASVLDEAKRLIDTGYTEIQLLGQNVNSYRDPSAAGWDFATLLDAVGNLPGIHRVRFTTSHPRDFIKPIVDAIAANPRLCNHIHLPVQSGSTDVLTAMRRQYNREQYMERISWMKNCGRPIAITSDIIVGFPGETEKDFDLTLSLLDDVGYDGVFCFKYSQRPNTPALGLPDHLTDDEKGRRLTMLMEKQRSLQIRLNAAHVGEVEEVMVEAWNQTTGQWIGRTAENKTLNFTHPETDAKALVGTYLPVLVTRAGPNSLVGEWAHRA